MAKRWTDVDRAKAQELRDAGLTSEQIGRKFGVTGSAVRALLSPAHLTRSRSKGPYYLSEYFQGPAIARCPTQERLIQNAVEGSAMLREALLRALA